MANQPLPVNGAANRLALPMGGAPPGPIVGTDGAQLATGGPMAAAGQPAESQFAPPDSFPSERPLTLAEFSSQYLNLRPGMKVRLRDVRPILNLYAKYRASDRQVNDRLRLEDRRFLQGLQEKALDLMARGEMEQLRQRGRLELEGEREKGRVRRQEREIEAGQAKDQTAFGRRLQLENRRQENRLQLEGERQRGRSTIERQKEEQRRTRPGRAGDAFGIERLSKVFDIWSELQGHIRQIWNSDMSNAEKSEQVRNITESRLYKEIVAFLMAQGVAGLSQLNAARGAEQPLPYADPSQSPGLEVPGGAGAPPGPPRAAPATPTPAPGTAAPQIRSQLTPGRFAPGASQAMAERFQQIETMPQVAPVPSPAAGPMLPERLEGPRFSPGANPPPARPRPQMTAPIGVNAPQRVNLPGSQPAGPQAPRGPATEEYRVNPQTGEVARRDPITGKIEIVGRLPGYPKSGRNQGPGR